MQLKINNDPLWQKILAYDPDEAGSAYPFSAKLAAEQGWTNTYTQRAIQEYKKFIYLCITQPRGASPSPVVDAVWHLHLTYTIDYWQRFCRDVLGREVHHHPSKGGNTEAERHRAWYVDTLRAYEETFGAAPPQDIWSSASPASHRVNPPGRNPNAPYWLLLLPFLITAMLYGQAFPYLLSGAHFLVFYTLMAVAVLAIALRIYRLRDSWLEAQFLEAAPFSAADAAYLSGGKRRLFLLFMAGLIEERAILSVDGTEYYDLDSSKLRLSSSPLASILIAGDHSSRLHYSDIRLNAIPALDEVSARHNDLMVEYRERGRFVVVLVAGLLALAAIRFIQGIMNSMPVQYLLLETVLLGMVGIIVWGRYHIHPVAISLFRRQQSLTAPIFGDLERAIIFSGALAIAGMASFGHLEQSYRSHNSGGGSSCGGDGSSGDGGGCGGCGGCGGD